MCFITLSLLESLSQHCLLSFTVSHKNVPIAGQMTQWHTHVLVHVGGPRQGPPVIHHQSMTFKHLLSLDDTVFGSLIRGS